MTLKAPIPMPLGAGRKSNIYTGAILLNQSFVELIEIDISREQEHSINCSFLLHNCRFTGWVFDLYVYQGYLSLTCSTEEKRNKGSLIVHFEVDNAKLSFYVAAHEFRLLFRLLQMIYLVGFSRLLGKGFVIDLKRLHCIKLKPEVLHQILKE